jgi:hypothetical protein
MNFRGDGVAEAPPGFQAGGLTVCIFLSFFVRFISSFGTSE